jgi:hypothetical protein
MGLFSPWKTERPPAPFFVKQDDTKSAMPKIFDVSDGIIESGQSEERDKVFQEWKKKSPRDPGDAEGRRAGFSHLETQLTWSPLSTHSRSRQ